MRIPRKLKAAVDADGNETCDSDVQQPNVTGVLFKIRQICIMQNAHHAQQLSIDHSDV